MQTAQLGNYMVSVKEHVQLETTRGYQAHLGVTQGWRMGCLSLDVQDQWGFLGDHVVNC